MEDNRDALDFLSHASLSLSRYSICFSALLFFSPVELKRVLLSGRWRKQGDVDDCLSCVASFFFLVSDYERRISYGVSLARDCRGSQADMR